MASLASQEGKRETPVLRSPTGRTENRKEEALPAVVQSRASQPFCMELP
jgi:hypothetical protein